ncbi:hypothetical protein L593_12845 [Salinarchaeum sp. Harcht-Bsk1]|nr:hypothetical protein L593_12845 [Salinarchaeum sp. Harcht-Bsk1]
MGVVLLVGIAVMLMTTVGVFVLGFGPGEQPPESDMQFHQESGEVVISVVRPAGLSEQDVVVTVENSGDCAWTGTGALQKAETVTISNSTPNCPTINQGDTIRVIWEAEGGGRTAIIGEYEVI